MLVYSGVCSGGCVSDCVKIMEWWIGEYVGTMRCWIIEVMHCEGVGL